MTIICKQSMKDKLHHALKLLVHVRPYIKGLFSYVKRGGKKRQKRENKRAM